MVGADILYVDKQTDQHDKTNSCLRNFLAKPLKNKHVVWTLRSIKMYITHSERDQQIGRDSQ